MNIGDRYGLLQLIQKVPKPKEKNRKGIYWLCKCDCGVECIKHYVDLSSGDTKSCGCLKKRIPIYDKNKVEISNHSGVYGFQNIYNGKWYIGKAKNLYNRYCDHKNDWKNHQEKQFYQAIKKYGWDSFNYFILEEYLEIPSKSFLSEREEYFIKEKDSYVNGYNGSDKSSSGFYSVEHEKKCTEILNELNKKQENENHPRTDFTKEEILEIFNYAMRGAPVREIYPLYSNHKISYDGFREIYQGQHFKDYLPPNWDKRPKVTTNSKFWGEEIIDIKNMLTNGTTIEDILLKYPKASRQNIRDIINQKTYKQINPCID